MTWVSCDVRSPLNSCTVAIVIFLFVDCLFSVVHVSEVLLRVLEFMFLLIIYLDVGALQKEVAALEELSRQLFIEYVDMLGVKVRW